MRVDPEELADREAIREVAYRYARGVDRLDAEIMRSAYWPEATDDHGRFSGNGWEFVDRVMATHGRWRATMHCNMNHSIEFDDGALTARGEISNLTYLLYGFLGSKHFLPRAQTHPFTPSN